MKNTPMKWIVWSNKNGIRTYLAHGLRLDTEATEIVNKSDLFAEDLAQIHSFIKKKKDYS